MLTLLDIYKYVNIELSWLVFAIISRGFDIHDAWDHIPALLLPTFTLLV